MKIQQIKNNGNSQFPQNNSNDNNGIVIQSKLKIGATNDPLEKEADDMSDRIMRMPEPAIIQRKCAGCEEKEKINRKPLSSKITPFVQRKSKGGAVANSNISSRIQSSRGGGNPLSSSTKNFMESRFGADFSGVRVHAGSEASTLSRDLNAKAFTVGKDVYFNKGQFAPETNSGKRLLAHELTHVVQQSGRQNSPNEHVQRYSNPDLWCDAFMELVEYEDAHDKLGVLTHYHSLSNERLVPLNYNIPSIFGEVDVDWMLRLAFIQYPFILFSIFTPSMAEGFGGITSRLGQIVLKAGWNTIRAVFPEWDLEYATVVEEGNWNSSPAIVAYVHQEHTLRSIFEPAITICENR